MRVKTRAMAAAAVTSLTLLAACGGGGTEAPDPATSETAGGQTGGDITIAGCTPENPLVPGATSETCGGNIIDAMTAKLVRYNPQNAAPENDIAESIESDDNVTFTVKLKPGYKFHDGTDVKAKNFVDAWNYTALQTNGQAGSYFYNAIKGFKEVAPGEGEKPTAETLSGLKLVDDTTFTIETAEPVSNLAVRLGYSAFAPLPDSFFADPKAFQKKPIGAGPFKLDSISNTEFVLSKFAEYSGSNPASVDKLTFRVYQDSGAAYADAVAGSLDFLDESNIPDDQFVGDAYKTDFEGRNSQREVLVNGWITFSPNDPQLAGSDKVELRKAISRAINRQEIVEKIFNNTRTPATGWVSPGVDGFKADTCGEACVFDPAAAKQAFDAAGGYDGTLTMTYNADAPNKAWSEAVCNSIKNTLSIECVAVPTVDFATFNKKIDADELKGIFRSAWQADYPSIENYLTPLYAKGADSNWSKYDNPEFEQLLTQAAAADTAEAANGLYQEAEALLARDFPTAPLWYSKGTAVWSDRVTDVQVNAFGVLDYSSIKVK